MNETDGVAVVTVGAVSGQLRREVVVELSIVGGSANSKYSYSLELSHQMAQL